MNNNSMNRSEMPVGLVMALSQNESALNYFSRLPSSQQQRIINDVHSIESKEEMKQYVDNLVSPSSTTNSQALEDITRQMTGVNPPNVT
ncbi:MAG: hypothetical protein GX286_06190 [Clostridiales bacterium]|jgi:uncharacterized protein YdeI (YjbR/CyaY-like superfamily)|nr:hypothetical protein [Clostridiales bacterium]